MPRIDCFPDHVERWAALRTSAHWEKQLAEALARCGVPVYLPLMTRVSVYESKRQKIDVPLFAGYVFCSERDFRGNPAVPPAIRSRVAQLLTPPDHVQLCEELAGIAGFLANRRLVQERIVGRPGETVRVVGGLFAGQHGIIRRLKPDEQQIVLEITFLGVRIEVDVEEHRLQKV